MVIYKVIRKTALLRLAGSFLAMIVISPAALLIVVQAVAQSPDHPEHKSTQSAKPEDEDLINPDRPGIADGSTVIGPRRVQIETGFQEEFRRERAERQHTLFIPTLLRIGIDDHWEARIEGNTFTSTRTFNPAGVVTDVSGVTPLSFGLKYHIQDSRGVRHPSLGMIARVFPPWGSRDFRTHHVTGDLRLAGDWDFAPRLKLSLNPNVGVGRYEDNHGKTFNTGLVALTLNYLPRKNLNPFVDMGLQTTEERDGKSSVIFDTGLAYIVGRDVQLDVSIGKGVHGRTPPHPFVGFGLSFRSKRFGRRK